MPHTTYSETISCKQTTSPGQLYSGATCGHALQHSLNDMMLRSNYVDDDMIDLQLAINKSADPTVGNGEWNQTRKLMLWESEGETRDQNCEGVKRR